MKIHFFGSDVSKMAEYNPPLGSEGDWLLDTDAKIQRSLNPLYKWSSSVGSSYLWVSHPWIQPSLDQDRQLVFICLNNNLVAICEQ